VTPIRQSDRAFGLTFAAVFSLIAGVGWFFFDSRLDWAFAVAALFLAISLTVPGILLPLNRLWSYLGHRLGHMNNYLLLGLFFFLFILPAAVIIRLIKWDPLRRRIDPEAKSYFSPVERHTDSQTFRDMF